MQLPRDSTMRPTSTITLHVVPSSSRLSAAADSHFGEDLHVFSIPYTNPAKPLIPKNQHGAKGGFQVACGFWCFSGEEVEQKVCGAGRGRGQEDKALDD